MSCRSTQPFAAVILLGLFCREQEHKGEDPKRLRVSVCVKVRIWVGYLVISTVRHGWLGCWQWLLCQTLKALLFGSVRAVLASTEAALVLIQTQLWYFERKCICAADPETLLGSSVWHLDYENRGQKVLEANPAVALAWHLKK